MGKTAAREAALRAQIEELKARLDEAEGTIRMIRGGHVDGLVVGEGNAQRVYTLTGADHPYRLFVEHMQQGAVTMTVDGTILYSNESFAQLVGRPLATVIGAQCQTFIEPAC